VHVVESVAMHAGIGTRPSEHYPGVLGEAAAFPVLDVTC
jgi:hypothetical protein